LHVCGVPPKLPSHRPTAEFLQSQSAGSGGFKDVGAVDDLKTGEVAAFA
jgi:hypothetical protein